jgi:DNA-binding MarR family transcriptional regulator
MSVVEREGPWLTDAQQDVWRRWLRMNAGLSAALHRQLHEDSGLSLQDFDVLVQLTDTAGGRVRVSTLANALGWERSRLSHHVKRMEGRGLVRREECPDDGRGAFVVLTPTGRAAIEAAAPAHARTVRTLVFDGLNEDELELVARFTERALSRLHPEGPRDPTDLIDDGSTAEESGRAAGGR